MGADEDGVAGFGKVVDEGPECSPRDGVHARGGLVQEEDRRIVQDGAAQRQPLFPAAGERSGHGGTAVGQVGHFKHVLLALGAHGLRHAVHAGEEIDVLFHRKVVVERELLRHVADVLADFLGLRSHVEPVDGRLPRGGRQQAAEHADGSGLARAVGSEEAENLALGHLERDVVHGHEGAESLHQVVDFHCPTVAVHGRAACSSTI